MSSGFRLIFGILLAVVVLVAGRGWATDIGDVALHGYGHWAYGETDGNNYLNGSEDGSYDNVRFALNVSATPVERLTIFAQFEFHLEEDGEEAELDFAFADWLLAPSLHLKLGQIKHPFGIYTEIYDVGTLRPFLELPQGIYGPQGIVAEAYRGVGLAGDARLGGEWSLVYDAYFGELESDMWHPAASATAALIGEEMEEEAFAIDSREVIGGRVSLNTPVAGLQFGVSAYRGAAEGEGEEDEEEDDPEEAPPPGLDVSPDMSGDRFAWGAHFEYLGGKFWARAEYAEIETGETTFSGSYLELAYKFSRHWQVAGLYDRGEVDGVESVPILEQAKVFSHEDLAAGVNFWFSPELVIKLEYHAVDGTRFAAPEPEDYFPDIMAGAFDTETKLIQLGVQYSF